MTQLLLTREKPIFKYNGSPVSTTRFVRNQQAKASCFAHTNKQKDSGSGDHFCANMREEGDVTSLNVLFQALIMWSFRRTQKWDPPPTRHHLHHKRKRDCQSVLIGCLLLSWPVAMATAEEMRVSSSPVAKGNQPVLLLLLAADWVGRCDSATSLQSCDPDHCHENGQETKISA